MSPRFELIVSAEQIVWSIRKSERTRLNVLFFITCAIYISVLSLHNQSLLGDKHVCINWIFTICYYYMNIYIRVCTHMFVCDILSSSNLLMGVSHSQEGARVCMSCTFQEHVESSLPPRPRGVEFGGVLRNICACNELGIMSCMHYVSKLPSHMQRVLMSIIVTLCYVFGECACPYTREAQKINPL